MSSALVVAENVDRDRKLLERARSFARGEGADLIVLALATQDEYDNVAETLETIGNTENKTYGSSEVRDAITGEVDEIASDVFGTDVTYEIQAQIADSDDQADAILEIAREQNCDHVFVPGRRRTPTGKAVFGDRTQQVLLNFEGFVTVAME